MTTTNILTPEQCTALLKDTQMGVLAVESENMSLYSKIRAFAYFATGQKLPLQPNPFQVVIEKDPVTKKAKISKWNLSTLPEPDLNKVEDFYNKYYLAPEESMDLSGLTDEQKCVFKQNLINARQIVPATQQPPPIPVFETKSELITTGSQLKKGSISVDATDLTNIKLNVGGIFTLNASKALGTIASLAGPTGRVIGSKAKSLLESSFMKRLLGEKNTSKGIAVLSGLGF